MERLNAIYRVRAAAADIQQRAQALAIEQSVEVPFNAIRDPRINREVVGQVQDITSDGPDYFRVTLALALETTGFEAGQLMNMLFGNSSLLPEVELVDMQLPSAALARFGGPQFGIDGLRHLIGRMDSALTCSALKPQGMTVTDLAALANTLASAGIDLIKDDHGLANQQAAPFAQRVIAVQLAVNAANQATGNRTLYAPNLTGGPQQLIQQYHQAQDAGVGLVMLAPMLTGLGALQELAGQGLPIIAHPAFGGATRIAPPLLFGKLLRLAGADAIIYTHHGGRFSSYSPSVCRAIADAARAPWGTLAPALPVTGGGVRLDRIEEIIQFYGKDVMLLIGGDLLAATDVGLAARAFVAKVRQTEINHS